MPWSDLHSAARSGDVQTALQLIKDGTEVNQIDDTWVGQVMLVLTAKGGVTPLHVAAEWGSSDVVKVLLKNGGDLLALTEVWLLIRFSTLQERWSPVHWAAWNGRDAVLQILIEAGASFNVVDSVAYATQETLRLQSNRTPLYLASKNGHLSCVELLLKAGCDVSIEDDVAKTLLSLTVNRMAAKQLMSQGAARLRLPFIARSHSIGSRP